MKNVFMSVINRGGYDLTGMLKRIDEYHISGRLTDAERDELISAARGDATPSVNAADEIQRLWAAIRDMRAELAEVKGEIFEGGDIPGNISEYIQPSGAHDAYYNGDIVAYGGKTYLCIAPDGVACVWSPDVMPGYWQEV